MPKLSLSVYLNAYSDAFPSNNPGMSNFKWNRDLNSILVENPTNRAATVAPGETLSLFSGMRVLLQDGTTEYSLALAPFQTSIYQLSWVGGTAPDFRTPRNSGADASTQVNVVVNGPIVTFSSFGGTFATASTQILGMTTPVTITANVIGAGGNSVLLVGDGVSTISALISAWNIANPGNMITLTSGVGTQVPALSAPVNAEFTGIPLGCSTSVVIQAVAAGIAGNVSLFGDGISTINALIAAWNLLNPTITLSLLSGDGTQVPSSGAEIDLIGGVDPNQIALAGGATGGTAFNLISGGVVVGDYVTIGSHFNTLNQGTFKIISMTATSFTVENLTGTNEGPITLQSDFLNQISIFSAAGVQVGDTLVISGGFSPASWGSYNITAVGAEFVQFSSNSVLPAEGPILTEAITIYSNAKTLVYIESDSKLDVILNTVDIGQIEPFMISNAALPSLPLTAIPGIFMLKSTVYSLAVTNNGLSPANIMFIAVE